MKSLVKDIKSVSEPGAGSTNCTEDGSGFKSGYLDGNGSGYKCGDGYGFGSGNGSGHGSGSGIGYKSKSVDIDTYQ